MRCVPSLRNVVACLSGVALASLACSAAAETLSNAAYRLEVTPTNGGVHVVLFDKVMNLRVADGPYLYRAQRHGTPKQKSGVITDAKINIAGNKLTIRGWLAGIEIEHTFTLPADRPILEERIVLHNKTGELIALSGFEAGLTRRVTDKQGRVLPELAAARVVAVPFRHRAIDAKGHFNDFSIHDLVTQPGSESWVNQDLSFFTVPSRHRWSEAWAVSVGKHTLGIFSFNQENMVFSVLSTVTGAGDVAAVRRRGDAARRAGGVDAYRPRRERRSRHNPLRDDRGRIPRGNVRVSRDVGREGLPLPQGFQPAGPLGTAL